MNTKFTVKEFINALRQGPYTSVGSYPIFFYTEDGAAFSFSAAKENALLIARAIRDGYEKQWEVIGAEINWEDADLYCDHSGERIESAYAEPKEIETTPLENELND